MSRFGDGGDDDSGLTPECWRTITVNALLSKRGKAALAELERALRALPEQRLIESALVHDGADDYVRTLANGMQIIEPGADQGEVCALGAWALYKRAALTGEARERESEALRQVYDPDNSDPWELADWAVAEFGVTRTLAYTIPLVNDEHLGYFFPEHRTLTPEERYEAFMDWLAYLLRDAVPPTDARRVRLRQLPGVRPDLAPQRYVPGKKGRGVAALLPA